MKKQIKKRKEGRRIKRRINKQRERKKQTNKKPEETVLYCIVSVLYWIGWGRRAGAGATPRTPAPESWAQPSQAASPGQAESG